MTELKSIWHTPPEQPDPFKSWNVLVVYEANDRKEMMYSTQFIHATDGMYVNRWCYLDDLLAYEKELIRTRKALGMALDWLEQVTTPAKCDDDLCREFTKRKLAEIKTALEEKEQQ